MSPVTGSHRIVAALVLFLTLSAGCAAQLDRTDEARVMAERFLVAVAGGSEDRGWSLLHPDARRDMFGGSMERFVNGALASDWTTFEFSVESVVPDDPSLYLLQVKANPPAFLTQPGDGNLWLLGDNQNGTATMAIRFEPFASGVWPSGG